MTKRKLKGELLSANKIQYIFQIRGKNIRMSQNCMRKGYRQTLRNDYGCITLQRVNEEWSMDIAGPLNPKTKLGNKYMPGMVTLKKKIDLKL